MPDDHRVYPGEITKLNADGTCAIAFDDGDLLDNVTTSNIVTTIDNTTASPAEDDYDDDDAFAFESPQQKEEADKEMQIWDEILMDENVPGDNDIEGPQLKGAQQQPALVQPNTTIDGEADMMMMDYEPEVNDLFTDEQCSGDDASRDVDNECPSPLHFDDGANVTIPHTNANRVPSPIRDESCLISSTDFARPSFEEQTWTEPPEDSNVEKIASEASLHSISDNWGYKRGDSDDLGFSRLIIPDCLVPVADTTLSGQLKILDFSLSAFMDAPPELRLTHLQYQAAALEQSRAHNQLIGHTWESGGEQARLDWMSTASSSMWAIAHVDALLQLRMRAVAVCRIRYGSASFEMVKSVLDLAQAYAQNNLWTQAASHAERASHILWSLEHQASAASSQPRDEKYTSRIGQPEEPYCDDDEAKRLARHKSGSLQVDVTLCSAMEQLFESLRVAALNHNGIVPWTKLVRILNSSGIPCLAEQPWGVREGSTTAGTFSESHADPQVGTRSFVASSTNSMTWGEAISFLRKHHQGFATVVRKIERSLAANKLALLLFVFDAAGCAPSEGEEAKLILDEDASQSNNPVRSGGVASALALRAAVVRTRAAAAIFTGTSFAAWLAHQCKRQLEALSAAAGGATDQIAVVPLTWEETVSAFAGSNAGQSAQRADIAEMRTIALSLVGRADEQAGRLSKARAVLQAALDSNASAAAARRDSATAAAIHTALANVLIREHIAWERAADERARKAAEEWLATDEGHRLWRSEVKRLIAEMRVKGTPGFVQLTRPEIECRARDVLLNARMQFILANASAVKPKTGGAASAAGFFPRQRTTDLEEETDRGTLQTTRKIVQKDLNAERIAEARHHLEAALQCDVATYGLHKNNVPAAIAMSALGNLAVVSGDNAEAITKLAKSVTALLTATSDRHQTASASVSVQLGRLLRQAKPSRAQAAECLAAAAQFYLDLAQKADADVDRYASLEAIASASTERRREHTTPLAQVSIHSSRIELASRARTLNARKAMVLWKDVIAILSKDGHDFAGSYEENIANALEKLYRATTLSDGEASISAMKTLRRLAKSQAEAQKYKQASASYLELQTLALRAGATDIANKAARARAATLADGRKRLRAQAV